MIVFDGYTEPVSKIAARKSRILATNPNAARVTKIIPPMTRSQWERMPLAFKYFCPFAVASKPLTILIDREV